MSSPLSRRSILCPSCGGSTELINRFVKLVVCSFCGQSISLTVEGPVALGQAAQLADLYTDLSIGAAGELEGRTFVVQGRARFEYKEGYWDEWYLLFDDGTAGWLHEDEGELSLLVEQGDAGSPDLGNAQVGARFSVLGVEAFVKEKRSARVYGAEGQLPRGLVQGAELRYVDAQHKGELFMLEELGGKVEVLRGKRLDDDALSVN